MHRRPRFQECELLGDSPARDSLYAEPMVSSSPSEAETLEIEPPVIDALPATQAESEEPCLPVVDVPVPNFYELSAPTPSPSLIPTADEQSQSVSDAPTPPPIENEREEAMVTLPEYETLEVLPAEESMCDEPITPSLPPVEAEAPVFGPALIALVAEESEQAVVVSSASPSPSLNPAAAQRSQSPSLILSTDAPRRSLMKASARSRPRPVNMFLRKTVLSRPLSFTPMLPNMRQPFSDEPSNMVVVPKFHVRYL